MPKKDYNIKDPAPYKAIDGSFHADMKGVKKAEDLYWDSMMARIPSPNLDLPLTDEQLRQIINYPCYGSLLSVLQDGLSSQLGEDESRGKLR